MRRWRWAGVACLVLAGCSGGDGRALFDPADVAGGRDPVGAGGLGALVGVTAAGGEQSQDAGGAAPQERSGTTGGATGSGGAAVRQGGAGGGTVTAAGGAGGVPVGGSGGASGGGAGGAQQAAGGTVGNGGRAASGGAPAAGGGAIDPCGTLKLCGSSCVSPSPGNGCGDVGCSPCPGGAPKNGFLTCDDGAACSFACLAGYVRSGDACVEYGAGGAGGAPSSGGSTGAGGHGVESGGSGSSCSWTPGSNNPCVCSAVTGCPSCDGASPFPGAASRCEGNMCVCGPSSPSAGEVAICCAPGYTPSIDCVPDGTGTVTRSDCPGGAKNASPACTPNPVVQGGSCVGSPGSIPP